MNSPELETNNASLSPHRSTCPLTDDDIAGRLNDGVPETLGEWILADGLTHMKIKTATI